MLNEYKKIKLESNLFDLNSIEISNNFSQNLEFGLTISLKKGLKFILSIAFFLAAK